MWSSFKYIYYPGPAAVFAGNQCSKSVLRQWPITSQNLKGASTPKNTQRKGESCREESEGVKN